jgi:ParB-like nuclease family protein
MTRAAMSDKSRHVRICDICPSPENAKMYRPVTPDDPETKALADSIRQMQKEGKGYNGILEPLVISADFYIISGHRRYCAADLAGLSEVPCRINDVRRGDDPAASDEFLKLLREHNRQRIKSRNEQLREAVIDADPEDAHRALSEYRRKAARIKAECIEIRDVRRRAAITVAKGPMLQAVEAITESLEDYWPITSRQIHYQLLNDPPLRHASKPYHYRNDLASYQDLSNLLTCARHEGRVSYNVIADPTRPVTVWGVHRNVQDYYQKQIADLFNDYWRDLLQSQPNHI